jgi:exodeoxyribonuclease VII small subunit
MPKSTSIKPVSELTYEAAFSELEGILTALEGEPESLEQSTAMFERGQALVQRCTKLLEQAELKIRRLSGSALVDTEED